jgi:segregation and condensation protein B
VIPPDNGSPEPESAGAEAPVPASVDESELTGALEAILLIVDTPVAEETMAAAVGFPPERVRDELHRLANRLAETRSGIHLRQVGGGWRFYTRDRFAPVVERFVLDGQQARLSRAALETLAVIAYRQPVTRARVSAVRGVNVDGVIRTLTARGLIEEVGSDSDTGGLLYRTTELFLERMGLGSLDELPPLGPLLPDVDALDLFED